jgi:hypothetical protein
VLVHIEPDEPQERQRKHELREHGHLPDHGGAPPR